MGFYFSYILASLIIIPAIIGWVRFHKIDSAFIPFLILTWVGAANELLNFFLVAVFKQYNVVNTNIYQLAEALLILWQFRRWRLLSNDRIFFGLFASFVTAFVSENVITSKLYLGFNSYFHILYSFVIVLLSINMMNRVLMKEREVVVKNPTFVICCVFIVLFTYTVLIETFWAYGINVSEIVSKKFLRIFVIINLLCNVIYTLVIIWMPKRQAFSLQY